MKITRSKLSEMVASEVRRRLRELVEFAAEDDDDSDDPKMTKSSADKSPSPKGKAPVGPHATNDAPDSGTPNDDESDSSGPNVDGNQPDPETAAKEKAARNGDVDDDSDENDDAVDADGDGGEEPSGVINDELSGKTVQAVTIEPESKVLPGAKEVVWAFNESTDTLRILITSTGMVKFFWRGQLHDLP